MRRLGSALRGQMSEAYITAAFLTLSGGFQDAYTYCVRGKVFANAQTGNIVLFGIHLFQEEWGKAARYLIPVCAFTAGIDVYKRQVLLLRKGLTKSWNGKAM